jgi:RNA polymerase sigma-70 factor (ECF subfamily)
MEANRRRQTEGDEGSSERLVAHTQAGDLHAFELLMRRHNQSLYRAVRSVLRDGGEVEDVMQETYCAAFQHLDQFAGRSKFSTWLLRIGINQALARLRSRRRLVPVGEQPEEDPTSMPPPIATPEETTAQHELAALVESAVDRLPADYRQVFVLRMVEGLDTADAAEVMGLTENAVKQRLHRARGLLQAEIESRTGAALSTAFGFLGARCDRVVEGVMSRITGSRSG